MARTPKAKRTRRLTEGITHRTGREIMLAIFGPEVVAELERLTNPDTPSDTST